MVDKNNIQNIYELTPMQDAILFNSILSEGEAFFEQISFYINSELDIDIFQKAWSDVVVRHDVLRSSFIYKKVEEPLQVVFKERELDFSYQDISLDKNKSKMVQNYKIEDRKKGFNLSKDKLFRITIFKQKNNFYSVIISFHHILMDGWCSSILYEEFKELYIAKLENTQASLLKTTPFVEYVKWLRENNEEKQKEFWSDYLKGYKTTSSIPSKKISKKQDMHEFTFELSKETTESLISLAKDLKVTINTLLQTIWAVLLSKYNNKRDVVFGTIVSGRPTGIQNIESMVGLFMNTIAIRIKYDIDTSFEELVLQTQKNILNFKENEYYPLAKIQSLSLLKNALLDHSFVFENYPTKEDEDKRLMVSDYNMEDFSGEDFTIQVIPSDKIYFKLMYNKEVYECSVIKKIEDDINLITKEVIKNKKIKIQKMAQDIAKEYKKEKVNTIITASFTTNTIEDNLFMWAKKFDIDVDISFSGYNQIFQELLDEDSKSSKNKDINVFLVRFEDFIRNKNLTDKESIEIIKSSYNSFMDILKNKKREANYFFGIFPISTHLNLSKELISFLNELNERQIKDFKEFKNIFSIDFRELDELYQVEEIFDSLKDKSGHLPFSDQFYTAYSTEIFRNMYALEKQHFKVIALDCDNTIWRGIVGEDGALGVEINDGYLELQKFIVQKEKEGFLIVLCSKNNEDDVWEVFEKNKNMILKKEHIINSKINWQAKSQNLKEMAQELNVGLNSFVFLDDNPLECSEVIKNAPEVLSIPLPKNSKSFKLFLSHIWAFDKLKITAEDQNRTKMYIAENQRSQSSQKLSMDDFLSSLKLKIYMNKMFDSQLERTSQLTQRTNQFNVSTIRRSEQDIKTLLENKNYVCWSINVEDKFGNYGLVGIVISQKKANTLVIDTFLMSCRVLGRGVENTILYGLKKYAKENALSKIEMDFFPTKKNKPALDFVQNSGFKIKDKLENKTIYELSYDNFPNKISYVDFYFQRGEKSLKKEETLVSNAISEMKNENNPSIIKHSKKNDFNFNFLQSLDTQEIEKITHKKFYEPLIFHKADDNLNLHLKSNTRMIQTKIIAPSNKTQKQLIEIYKALLNIQLIGIQDCFFELGGHSLSATRLLSRVYQSFKVDLSLQDIFSNPSVEKLSKIIKSKDKSSSKSIKLAPKMKNYPLSNAQKRVWLIDKMGETSAYNMPITLELNGELDINKLELVFNKIIARHEILRTEFITIEDEPRQKILKKLKIKFNLIKDNSKNITKIIDADAYKQFDLTTAPLFRVKLFKINNSRYIFYFNTHHIISDAWSLGVITDEINHLYNDESLEPLKIQYKDYTLWQNEYLNSKNILDEQKYWYKKFKKTIKPLDFPIDFARFRKQRFNGNSIELDLSDYSKKIGSFNEKETTTLFMFLTSIIKTLLARYTNEADIILGFAISARDEIELENQIGFYANTLALRDTVDFENDFYSLLKQVKQTVLEAHQYQKYPFESLVNDLNLSRDISRSPIFDYAISLNNENSSLELGDIKISPSEFKFKIAQFDMSFNFSSSENQLILDLNYNTDLFKKESIKRILNHIKNLISNILLQPDEKLKNIEFLSKSELKKEFRTSKIKANSIIGLFQKQVSISPHSSAVNFYDTKLSYKELDEMSNSLANYLIDKANVSNGDIVAFLIQRSELSVVCLLAILKANATFLPLNISLPQKRVDYIIKDSKAKIILTKEILLEALKYPLDRVNTKSALSSSAYVIYTSGTTGNPKGVEVSEKSLVNLCNWYSNDFNINKETKALLMIPTSFDASIKNILAPLFVGGEVVISKEQFDPYDLLEIIDKRKVNLINCVPSAFKSILDISKDYKKLKSLKYIAVGGESLDISVFKDFYLKTDIKLFNIYGPTEATDIATLYQVTKNDLDKKIIPIGREIPNVKIFILDKFGNIAPTNVIGELVIGGSGLAKGYLNNKKLSDEKFIHHQKLGRIYTTGDLARELDNRDIEFIGRSDDQIKIMGNRVETKEVEHMILEIKEVDVACVLLKEDRLVAFIKLSGKRKLDYIKEYLQSGLPSYMVPTDFIKIKNMPLTQNGKIDKQSLLNIKPKIKKEIQKKLTTLEKKLLHIFEEVLNKNISINDNFFEVGGNSLNAVKIISKINTVFAKKLKLSTIFEYQNVKDFSKYLENEKEVDSKIYTIFNSKKDKAIFVFPSLIDSIDYKITPSKLSKYLSEYKIYAFDFILNKDRVKEYAKLVNSLEEDFIFLGYSSGGNLAFEVIKELTSKPKKLILIDSWKIKKFNSITKKDVLAELKNSDLEINHPALNPYIEMLNSVKNLNQIDTEIDLIKTENKGKNGGNKYIDQHWNISTRKNYKEYLGFGNHLDMLKDDFLIKNCKLLNAIIQGEKE